MIPHKAKAIKSHSRLNFALCVILSAVICLRHALGVSIPLPVVSLLSLIVVAASLSTKISVCIPVTCFILVYAFTLILHPFPETWLRAQRFVAFVIGMICFSPLIISDTLKKSREWIAASIYVILSLMVILSFAIWGICLIISGHEGIWTPIFHNYGFCGVFEMGMVLSPVAAITAIVTAWLLIDKTRRISPFLGSILLGISIVMCAVGGSRAALGGMALSLLVLLYLNRKAIMSRLTKKTAILTAIAGILVLIAVVPPAMTIIKHKTAISESHGSLFYSRKELWDNRIREFKSSPLLGIGYANELPSSKDAPIDLTEIEPGSSWLSLLSYGGVIGTASFLVFAAVLIKRLVNIRHNRNFPFYLSLLLFMTVNASTEGWLMFAGSLMFPIFWLTATAIWTTGIPVAPNQFHTKNE